MRKILILWAVAICFSLAAADSGLAFHFDFCNAAGKSEVTDLTGKVHCVSENKLFVIQEKALRLADGVKIRIADKELPRLTERFTFNIWLNKCFFGFDMPVLFKGMHPYPVQFLFSLFRLSPNFKYKTHPDQRGWKGVYCLGNFRSEAQYAPHVIKLSSSEITAGVWVMATVTYDRGTVTIYLNGKPVVRSVSSTPEKLPDTTAPLYLGAELVPETSLNYQSADMLVNDFRLYSRALTESEVAAIYRSEQNKYPTKNLFPPNAVRYPVCNEYLTSLIRDADPEFKTELKRTVAWRKKGEKPLPAGKGHTSASVRPSHGQIGLFINGREYFPFRFFPTILRDGRYHMKSAEAAIRDFAAAGTELGGGGPGIICWEGRGKYDFEQVDKLIRRLCAAGPQQQIQIVLFIRPHGFFFNKHDAELERYYPRPASGGKLRSYYIAAPFGSQVWLECSNELLRDLICHMESQEYADRIFGYHFLCGDAGEWYWSGSFTGGIPGYSEVTRKSFQEFLRRRYKTDSALQKAWKNSKVTLANAAVPTPEDRLGREHFLFRDYSIRCNVSDFRDYMEEKTLLNLTENCRTIKESCGKRKIVTIYNGYSMLYAGLQNTAQYGALNIYGKVLRLPWVDCFATPLDYTARRGGEEGANINAFNGSTRLHGKMLWHEDDLRTHFHHLQEFGRTDSMRETIEVMRRCFGYAQTMGAGYWYCPVTRNYIFHNETIMDEVAAENRLGKKLLTADRSPVAEAALVFDEQSEKYTAAPCDRFLHHHNWGVYTRMHRMGAPFDGYLFSDLEQIPDYKLYIFTNLYFADAKTLARVQQFRKNHPKAVIVWNYAPGYLSERGFDEKNMEKLTGFRLKAVPENAKGTLKITDTGSPVTAEAGKQFELPVGPWFYCTDSNAKVLGTFQGKPALVQKGRNLWTLMPLTREMLTGLCDLAGIHVYSRSGDVLTANKSTIMLHTSTAGNKKISLPGRFKIEELFSGKKFPEGNSFNDSALPSGTTRVYRIEPVKK